MSKEYRGDDLKNEALILHWREDPVAAAEDLLNVWLDKHQKIVLRSRWTHSRQYDVLSRGTGKTFMNAVTAALRAMLYPGHRVGLIAPSFRQSKLMFEELKKLYDISPAFQESAPAGPKTDPEKCWFNFISAPGYTGSYIEAMPLGSDGAKIRGARFFTVIADELAQIDSHILDVVVRGFMATKPNPKDAVALWEEQQRKLKAGEITEDQIIKPAANKFFGSSTAFYQYNHLWERVQKTIDEIQTPIKQYQIHHQVSLEQALAKMPGYKLAGGPLNEGQIPFRLMSNGKLGLCAFGFDDVHPAMMDVESIEDSKREMSDYLFRMEYTCFFPPDSEGFFRRSMLDAARTRAFSPVLEPRKGMLYTMGIDPARTNDNFSIVVYEVDPAEKRIHLARVYAWNSKNFVEMHKNVRDIARKYHMDYFEMDAGGGGTTIRDLLARPELCPPGDRLILERDFDEHRALNGDRKLGPLIQFSNGDWVHDANHNLLSGLQHGLIQIAGKPPCGDELWTQEKEDANDEIEGCLTEMSTIIVVPSGSRMRWDTPTKNQRKDRYSAALIGYNAALKVLDTHGRGKSLPMGGWI